MTGDGEDNAQVYDLHRWVITRVSAALGLGREPVFKGVGVPVSVFEEAFARAFHDDGSACSDWFSDLVRAVNDPLGYQGLIAPTGATDELYNFTVRPANPVAAEECHIEGPVWIGELVMITNATARLVIVTPAVPYVRLVPTY
jgi:hypothetical protein